MRSVLGDLCCSFLFFYLLLWLRSAFQHTVFELKHFFFSSCFSFSPGFPWHTDVNYQKEKIHRRGGVLFARRCLFFPPYVHTLCVYVCVHFDTVGGARKCISGTNIIFYIIKIGVELTHHTLYPVCTRALFTSNKK